MKQHITREQYSELTEEQKLLLYNIFYRVGNKTYWWRLTIGLMIEFLGDDWLQIITEYCEDCDISEYPDNDELCDSLWEATKHKLKANPQSL